MTLDRVVNFKEYPIKDLTSAEGRALVEKCRARLAVSGACEMENFVTEEGLAELVKEGSRFEHLAYFSTVEGNAYLEEAPAGTPEGDPRRMTETTRLGAIAYDQFPPDSILRQLYEWDPLMYFIGAVLELKEIYRYGDVMSGLNLAVMKDGDYLRWHFDQTDFVTSLAIQSADEGGIFEYAPMIRRPGEENFERVKRVLKGDREEVGVVPTLPGSLVLFKGRYSLHRVTPIKGNRTRLLGLLAYDTKPGQQGTDHLRQMRYGRTK